MSVVEQQNRGPTPTPTPFPEQGNSGLLKVRFKNMA